MGAEDRTVAAAGPDLDEALRKVFDPAHYLRAYPDIAAAGVDPFLHYMRHGWREGRDPAPSFDARHYVEKAGLAPGKANPLVHFVTTGRALGLPTRPPAERAPASPSVEATAPDPEGEPEATRAPAPARPEAVLEDRALAEPLREAFDAAFYIERNPDVAAAGLDPLLHFLSHGWREGRDPAPWFSAAFYLAEDPDLAEAGANSFLHYLAQGRAEGRPTRASRPPGAPEPRPVDPADLALVLPEIDAASYLRRHPDAAAAGLVPAAHYLAMGAGLGLDPAPGFSTDWYARRHPVVGREGVNPFVHFLRSGRREELEPVDPVPGLRATYAPTVSVVLAGEGSLARTVEVVAAQTCRPVEVVVVGTPPDAEALAALARADLPHRVVERPAASPVQRWREGLALAGGELAWLLDGSEEVWPDALERLVGAFADPSVMLGWARSDPGAAEQVRPAALWARDPQGALDLLLAPGCALVRRAPLPEALWDGADELAAGRSLVLLGLAAGGQVCRVPGAATPGSEAPPEAPRALAVLRSTWGARTPGHVLIGLGRLGNEEALLPIALAGALARRGLRASLLAASFGGEVDPRRGVDPRVPLYHARHVVAHGWPSFRATTGATLVHTLGAEADLLLADLGGARPGLPWIASLRPSHAGLGPARPDAAGRLAEGVDLWLRGVDEGLALLAGRGVPVGRVLSLDHPSPEELRGGDEAADRFAEVCLRLYGRLAPAGAVAA